MRCRWFASIAAVMASTVRTRKMCMIEAQAHHCKERRGSRCYRLRFGAFPMPCEDRLSPGCCPRWH